MQLLVSSVFLTMLEKARAFPELCHMSGCPCVRQALERNPVHLQGCSRYPLDAASQEPAESTLDTFGGSGLGGSPCGGG